MESYRVRVVMLIAALAGIIALFVIGMGLHSNPLPLLSLMMLTLAAITVLQAEFKTSILIIFVYVGFEGFFKIITNYNPIIHVGADLLAGALTFRVVLAAYFGHLPRARRYPPGTTLIILHTAWFLISFLNPFALSLLSSLAGIKVYLSMMLLYFFGYYLVNTPRDVRIYVIPWLVIAIVHAWLSVYQSLEGPSSVLSIHPRYAMLLSKLRGSAFRPFGLTNLPGGPAVYIYIAAPILVYFLFTARSILVRLLLALQLPIFIGALLVCQVRSAILKAIVGGSIVFLPLALASLRRSPKVFARNIAFSACALGISLTTLPSLTERLIQGYALNSMAMARSMSVFDVEVAEKARQGSWERFWRYAEEIPFGAGLSRTGAAAGKFAELARADEFFPDGFFTDNLFVALVVDLGLPGVLIFTLFVAFILYKGFMSLWKISDPYLFDAQIVAFACLVAIAMGSYGSEAIIYNPEACFFWFFSGAMMRLATKPEVYRG